MFVVSLELNAGTRTVGFTGERHELIEQPICARATQQVIAPPEAQIIDNIAPARRLRASLRFGQRQLPGVFEFAHRKERKK